MIEMSAADAFDSAVSARAFRRSVLRWRMRVLRLTRVSARPPPVRRCNTMLATKNRKSGTRIRSAAWFSASAIATPMRVSSSTFWNAVPTGAATSRAAKSIASSAGRPALTARTIRSMASGKASRNRRWYLRCAKRSRYLAAAAAAAVLSPITSTELNPIKRATNPVSAAAAIPVKTSCGSPIRLPAAAKAASRRAHSPAGTEKNARSRPPRGNGLRSETPSSSSTGAVIVMVFNRCSRRSLLRSMRTAAHSPAPSSADAARTVRRNRSSISPSGRWRSVHATRNQNGRCQGLSSPASGDFHRLEQFLVEVELRRARNEIGPHPARHEFPIDRPVAALAPKLERKELAHRDGFAFHAGHLADVLHPADAVAHALDVYDQVERARDVHSDRPQRQVEISHYHHVFQAVERVARRVGVNRRHRAVMPGVHRLEHVECLGAPHLADDNAVRPHAQRITDELALRDVAGAFDVGWARLHLNDMRLLKAQFDGVLDRDHPFVAVDEL